jgi:mediator of RNA polymerase II transcription subunit 5
MAPSRETSDAVARSVQAWVRFLDKCLVQRLDASKFASFAPLQQSKHPLPPAGIAFVLLRPTRANHNSLDPRVPQYLEVLLQLGLLTLPATLRGLYAFSTNHTHVEKHRVASRQAGDAQEPEQQDADGEEQTARRLRWASSYSWEEVIFYRLGKGVRQVTSVRNAGDVLAVCDIMARWMALFTAAAQAFADEEMSQLQARLDAPPPTTSIAMAKGEMENARAAFVVLLLNICDSPITLRALSLSAARSARHQLSEALARFVPTIMQNAGELAGRLELFRTQTLAGFEPVDKAKAEQDAELGEILESTMGVDNYVIPELPISHSRAGLYIYLNAALVGMPLLDDYAFLAYLQNRYRGNVQACATDLIIVSFDVVANAVIRNEGRKSVDLLRSYLINKVPVIVATLAAQAASTMFPVNSEYCVTAAVNQVDTRIFPPLSALFDETGKAYPMTENVRTEFCFACALHGLIPESSIEGLVGELPMQSMPRKYVKEVLVQECLQDTDRMQALTGELENMEGNTGAVAQALTEVSWFSHRPLLTRSQADLLVTQTQVLGRLCSNKETMSLKLLCHALAQKPQALDVLLLFDKPTAILQPLCELLDNWKYDEDQGESQPVYEEFGGILLLVLAFVYRYRLSPSDMGIQSADSFVARFLVADRWCKPLDELTDQEKKHLATWVHGLFDSEAGGLSDEVMSSCPPQDFYRLLPTLFQQIIQAVSTKYLSEETIKGGVECKLETHRM